MARKLSTAEVLPALLVVRPDRRFIEALLLEGHSPAFIERVLGNADLPVPTDDELDSIRSGLPPTPKAFKPRAASHKPSAGYLERLGLLPYFRDTPEWQQARAVLAAPRVREVVESGLVLTVPLDQLGHIVRLQLRHHVSPAALAVYAALLLDVSSIGRSQLRVVVRERVRLAVLRVHGDDPAEAGITRAVDADARTLATTLPSSKLAWGSVLLQLGFQLNRLELPTVIDHVADVAAIRAAAMVLRGAPGDEEVAERFTNILAKMKGVRASINAPDLELHQALAKFTLKTDDRPVMNVAQLRARGEEVSTGSMPTRTIFDRPDDGDDGDDDLPDAKSSRRRIGFDGDPEEGTAQEHGRSARSRPC